ncbi:hypothetical protein WJX79_003855 [Trebouxia sp. C0005]
MAPRKRKLPGSSSSVEHESRSEAGSRRNRKKARKQANEATEGTAETESLATEETQQALKETILEVLRKRKPGSSC